MALPCAVVLYRGVVRSSICVPSGDGANSLLFTPLSVFIAFKKLVLAEEQKTVGNFFVVVNPDRQDTYIRKIFLCSEIELSFVEKMFEMYIVV